MFYLIGVNSLEVRPYYLRRVKTMLYRAMCILDWEPFFDLLLLEIYGTNTRGVTLVTGSHVEVGSVY